LNRHSISKYLSGILVLLASLIMVGSFLPGFIDEEDRRFNVIRNDNAVKVCDLSIYKEERDLEPDIASELDEFANTVKGSEELALEILNELSTDAELKLNIHYCSARFKDRQQLTNRIKRRAKNVKQPHYVVTGDGTFLIGIIEPVRAGHLGDLVDVQNYLHERFKVPQKLMKLDEKLHRLEVASWVLDELRNELEDKIKERCFIIEEYPTANPLEVERTPLGEFK